jgi:hypothetical protein
VQAAYDMSRYEIIMERAPFGKAPLPDEAAAPPRPAGEFAKQYRLCMLYEDAQGRLKAGLVSKTNNKNFFLQVGESESGLSLAEVRLEDGVAVLQQGGETAQLILEGLGTPRAAVPQQVAMNPAPAGLTPAQIIRRAGAEAAPEHILAALADSSPKPAKLTVRKTEPPVSPGASSELPDEPGLSESLNSNANRPAGSAGKANGEVAQARALSNYAVQSVPLHLQKKLLAKGL